MLPHTLNVVDLMSALQREELSGDEIVIDFLPLTFAPPQGMASLACLMDSWLYEGKRLTLKDAPWCKPFEYLQRMNFFQLFNVFTNERFTRHAQKGRFAAMDEVCEGREAKKIATNLANSIIRDPVLEIVKSDLNNCLYESINNILDHAGLKTGRRGFAAAQSYRKGRADRKFVIAIVDSGRGIANALRDNSRLSVPDDRTALDLACQPGVTGAEGIKNEFGDPRNVGQGLYQIDQIAEFTQGSFVLCSGKSRRERTAGQVEISEPFWYWQGTMVVVTLTYSGIRRYIDTLKGAGKIRLA